MDTKNRDDSEGGAFPISGTRQQYVGRRGKHSAALSMRLSQITRCVQAARLRPTWRLAKLSTVEAGGWAKYQPHRGFAMVQRFMEKEGRPGEKNRESRWFDVLEGWALECLVIGEGELRRVYVVTTEPPTEYAWIHDRWPLLTMVCSQ